jgi:hypothetical protein
MEDISSFIITPSLIDETNGRKIFNVGDELVKQLTLRTLFNDRIKYRQYAYWQQHNLCNPSGLLDDLSTNRDIPVIVAGTNCIKDDYSLVDGIPARQIGNILNDRFVAVLFSGLIGTQQYGAKGTLNLEPDSDKLLRTILDNGIISARCGETYKILVKSFPEHKENIYLTGCVTATSPINIYKSFEIDPTKQIRVLFSFTSRSNSAAAEAQDLLTLIHEFGENSIDVILNQHRIDSSIGNILRQRKIRIVDGTRMSADQYYSVLSAYDFHYGSRAHVHIPMCSMGIRSFLTGFEQRHSIFQDHYSPFRLKIGDLAAQNLLTMLCSPAYENVKVRISKDLISRYLVKKKLSLKIRIESSSFNIKGASQWMSRQDYALSYLIKQKIKEITELGSGMGKLGEKLIDTGIAFRGYDIISRSKKIQQLDISKATVAPRSRHDVLLCLGLLEYLESLESFVDRWLRKYSQVFLTYNAVAQHCLDDPYALLVSETARSSREWKNSFSLNQLVALFQSKGITIRFCAPTKYSEKGRLYCEYFFHLITSDD